MSIIAGIGWHVIGAGMAASFYAPIEKVKKWSWETTWAVAGLFSWILLPISVSLILLPDFQGFYASMGPHLLLKVALFGAMWGVGNVSYGLTMRHLGMSLGIGVAIGVTLIVGTLVPPLMHGQACDAVHDEEWIADDGGHPGGTDWSVDCFVCRASKGSATAGRASGIQFDAGAAAGGDVRDFFIGNVVCDRRGEADGGRGATPWSEPAVCGAAKLRDHHGRRCGSQPELLLYPAGGPSRGFRSAPT